MRARTLTGNIAPVPVRRNRDRQISQHANVSRILIEFVQLLFR